MCGLEALMLALTLQHELLKSLVGDRYDVTSGMGEYFDRKAKIAEVEAILKKCSGEGVKNVRTRSADARLETGK